MGSGLAGSNSSIFLYGINLWDEDTGENYLTFGKSSAVRTVTCIWTDRNIMVNNLGGFSGFNLYNQFYYIPAASYPAAPGLLFFSKIDIQGLGVRQSNTYQQGGVLVGYQWARCRIHYESLPWPPLQPGILSIDYAVDSVTMPQPTIQTLDAATGAYMTKVGGVLTPLWKFATTGNFVNAAQIPGKQNILINLTWQIFNQLSIPASTLYAYAGKVNSTSFLGASEGQVLFPGARTNRRLNTQGVEMWDITYPFLYNSFGWQSVYNPQTGLFEKIVDQNSDPPFPEADLNSLVPGIAVP